MVIIVCYRFKFQLSYTFINFDLQMLILFIDINAFLCALLHVNILAHLDSLTDSCYGWPHSRIIIQTLLHPVASTLQPLLSSYPGTVDVAQPPTMQFSFWSWDQTALHQLV